MPCLSARIDLSANIDRQAFPAACCRELQLRLYLVAGARKVIYMIDKIGILQPPYQGGSAGEGPKDVHEVASEFESLFIYYMLKTMRNSVMESDLFGDGRGENIYKSMLDNELARVLAKGDGVGLKVLLERQLMDKGDGHQVQRPLLKSGPYACQDTSAVALQPPLNGSISSDYGIRSDPVSGVRRFHHGVDIAAPEGRSIYAAGEGMVIYSGEKPGYGNLVEIRHENGLITRYGHNLKNLVEKGEKVDPSKVIALVGSTGRATGPHLHFEVRMGGVAVNPADMLPFG